MLLSEAISQNVVSISSLGGISILFAIHIHYVHTSLHPTTQDFQQNKGVIQDIMQQLAARKEN